MTFRNHRGSTALVLMGLAAVLLAVPATASAGSRDRRGHAAEDRDRRGHAAEDRDRHGHRDEDRAESRHHDYAARHRDRHAVRDDHQHGWRRHFSVAARHHHGVRSRHARAAAHRHHVRREAEFRHDHPFYCRPCGHRFASRDGFHDHLHHRHRVARHILSRVIVHSALGWVFYG